jgi:hypothetical protein
MKSKEDSFSEKEAASRRDEALRRALNTPPKPIGKKKKSLTGKASRSTKPSERTRP